MGGTESKCKEVLDMAGATEQKCHVERLEGNNMAEETRRKQPAGVSDMEKRDGIMRNQPEG